MIHPTAIIDADAVLGQNVEIGPYCVVGPGVVLGDDVVLSVTESLSNIISQVQSMSARFTEVNYGMGEQAAGAERINASLICLADAVRETADSLRSLDDIAGELHATTELLVPEESAA